jgi:Predicted membrane protein
MHIARLILRVVIGGLFIGHGMQKLAGWFGGGGLGGTEKMMERLDLEPARENAMAAGATEAAGGVLLVVGAATPLAAAGLIGTMLTAIRTVHFKNGLWNAKRGWEFNAVLIAALMALTEAGPGRASVDGIRGRIHRGTGWAFAALAAGAAASTAIVEFGHHYARAKRTLAASDEPATPAM